MSSRPSTTDRLGRHLRDLRISVTDRCNLRCRYCMPEREGLPAYGGAPREDLLRFEEIASVASAAVRLGVRKLRVTGGEPLLRNNLPELICLLAATPGIEDLALTTNGLLLPQFAASLKAAGLHRVTVSLDALDDVTFRRVTGRASQVREVLDGIDAARAAGLSSIKVNVVLVRGLNEEAALPLVEHFRHQDIALRFIEYMDVGNVNEWRREDVIPSAALMRQIDARYPLEPLPPDSPGEVARRFRFVDGAGEVGFISSITAPFCGDCNRLRLSAVGDLHTCLFSKRGHPLRELLRAGVSGAELEAHLAGIWRDRADRYSEARALPQPETPSPGGKVEMHEIGG